MNLAGIILPLLRNCWPFASIGILALLCWHLDARAIANANAVREQAAQYRQAQTDAAEAANRALQTEEANFARKSQAAEAAYQHALADAHALADRYIALHRLHAAPGESRAGAAPATAEGSSPFVPAEVPGSTVVVSASDVQACTAAVTYAIAAHNWAIGIDEEAR